MGKIDVAAMGRALARSSVHTKFLMSFGMMLAIVCGIGAFALAEFHQLATINHYFNADIVPGLTNSSRLIDDRSKLRVAELKYLGASDAAAAKAAETTIIRLRARLPADLQ